MKNLLLSLILPALILTGCQDEELKSLPKSSEAENVDRVFSLPKTTIEFEEQIHDFGTIKEGDIVKFAYKFKNTGDNPLEIAKADVTCGCTVPSIPTKPIPPGGTDEITVQFNSSHKSGKNEKNVMIYSNAQEGKIPITFRAEVEEK